MRTASERGACFRWWFVPDVARNNAGKADSGLKEVKHLEPDDRRFWQQHVCMFNHCHAANKTHAKKGKYRAVKT